MNQIAKLGRLDRDNIRSSSLIAVTLLVLLGCIIVGAPFLSSLVWALSLAISFHPLHRWVSSKIRKEGLAAGLTVTLIAIVFIVPLALVTFQAVGQAQSLLTELQRPEVHEKVQGFISRFPALAQWVEGVNPQKDGKKYISALASRLPNFASVSLWKMTEIIIIFYILFFFIRDSQIFICKSKDLLPLDESESRRVFKKIEDTIKATVYGHVAIAFIQGFLGGLLFWILGIPASLFWGAVMAIFALLPILGTAVIWIPAVAFLAFQGDSGKALILFLWGSVVVGLIDNLLYPAFVGKRLQEHTLPVFLSIFGGILVMGATGIIVGPLLLALAEVLIEICKDRAKPIPREAG